MLEREEDQRRSLTAVRKAEKGWAEHAWLVLRDPENAPLSEAYGRVERQLDFLWLVAWCAVEHFPDASCRANEVFAYANRLQADLTLYLVYSLLALASRKGQRLPDSMVSPEWQRMIEMDAKLDLPACYKR